MTTETGKLCINFPGLVAGAANLPECVAFFDPGLGVPHSVAAGDDPSRYHCPEDMPMDDDQARRYLAAMLELGKSFKKPSDVAQLLAMDESLNLGPDLRSEFAALERFAEQEAGIASKRDEPSEDAELLLAARARAQRTLILARATQERDAETGSISRDLDASFRKFESSLGFDEEDEEERSALGATDAMNLAGEGHALSRGALFEALVTLLGDSVLLVSADPEVASDAEEWCLEARPVEGDALAALAPGLETFSGVAAAVTAPAWKLCGRKSAPLKAPWLNRDITIVLLRP